MNANVAINSHRNQEKYSVITTFHHWDANGTAGYGKTGDDVMTQNRKTDTDRLEDAADIIRKKNLEINDLKRTISQIQKDNDTAEAIRQELYGLAAHTPDPRPWTTTNAGHLGKRGCPITMLSDIHYGEVVDKDQTNGRNVYNKKIAKERIFRYFDTVIDLSYNHMGRAQTEYPGVITCFGGDMIGGDIHEELMRTNDRTPHQAVNDLTDILAAGIEKLASKFQNVFVPCVVGNHGRSTKRLPMKHRVFTNYDWSIYCNLERLFRANKHIQIYVPSSADAHFNSFGTRFLLTHGDSLGVRGGDGIIGAIGPIMRGTLKLRDSEIQFGQEVDHVLMGHWHQLLFLPRVTVNNSVKGFDEFTLLGLRAPYSRPSQALLFSHPEHGITARWEIYLEGKRSAAKSKPWVSWPKEK